VIDPRLFHTEYRRAVEAVRDPSLSPEARKMAEDDMIAKRHALDEALVAAEEERADTERAAAVERAAEISFRASVKTGVPDVVAEQRKAMREFCTYGSDRRKLFVPFEARATDITTVEDTNIHSIGMIPTTILGRVLFHANATSGVLACNNTVLRTATGEQINIPYLSVDGTAASTAQGSAATESDPHFLYPVLNAYRKDGWYGVTKEFLDDAVIDVEGFLAEAAGRSLATLIASDAAAGDGSGNPAGINYTGSEPTTLGVTSASATTFTMDDLITLWASVPAGARARGEFVAGDTAWLIIHKMKTDDGAYLLTPSKSSAAADTLFGCPLHNDAWYQACTTGLIPVTFGDMSNFWVRYARGVEFSRSDDMNFTSFESVFRFALWFDCVLAGTINSVNHLHLG
jgi:HK97 family phage major capsid protein